MPRVSLLLAVLAVGSSAWGRYAFEEDFSVVGADGGVAGVDLEENTLYSHKHRKVEDGRYAILLSGNRHYLATPALRDFSFAMDWGFERLFADARDLGFRVRFHDDRAAYGGHELAVFCDNGNVLHLTLDGADFHTRKIAPPELNFGGTLRLTVSGSKGRVKVAGWINGHEHFWMKEPVASYRGEASNQDSIRGLYLPSAGLWGDIGYVEFRTGATQAVAKLVQKDYWFHGHLHEGEEKPETWKAIIEENDGQVCRFPFERAYRKG